MEKERDLREFAERVKKKYKDKIEKIVLFGSLARGEHRETSDTDLLVITSGNSFDMQKRLSEVAVDVLLENGVYVSQKQSPRKNTNS
ncbi:MAG: nucleotidyltransferase domain-containing protein [Candidatus Freyarchaeota archaeon]